MGDARHKPGGMARRRINAGWPAACSAQPSQRQQSCCRQARRLRDTPGMAGNHAPRASAGPPTAAGSALTRAGSAPLPASGRPVGHRAGVLPRQADLQRRHRLCCAADTPMARPTTAWPPPTALPSATHTACTGWLCRDFAHSGAPPRPGRLTIGHREAGARGQPRRESTGYRPGALHRHGRPSPGPRPTGGPNDESRTA